MERALLLLLLLLSGCAGPRRGGLNPEQDRFWAGLQTLCGGAFDGRVASKTGGGPGPDPYDGKRLLLEARQCTDRVVRLYFTAGAGYPRVWVLTRAAEGLRLVHEQYKDDGAPEPLSGYGGLAAGRGTAETQRFPADALSGRIFAREGLPDQGRNVWTVTLVPERMLRYSVERPGREFTLEFDLSAPLRR